ncbi:MAG: F0F1 ATP synthase subunit B [Gammaproteobacteria bacterium]
MDINATLLGQAITFAILVWFTMRFVWPPLIKAMEERARHIADGLAAAEKGRHDLELAESRAKTLLREGKQHAQEAIAHAQKRADEIIEEAKAQARIEGGKIVAAAHAQGAQELRVARDALQKEVAQLALAGAEQVLMREVDAARHREVLDKLSARL